MKSGPTRRESFDIAGCKISAVVAGNPNHPAVLLLHGFPSSSRTFRNIVPRLSQACFVIAPDLPGFGQSDLIADPSFVRFTDLIEGLLAKLGVLSAYLYLHDFGAPVGLDLAMRDPSRVLGLIVQNANAHRTGFGPAWQDTIDYWHAPSKENERAATAHLTFEGLRNEYVGGVPDDIASRISADNWIEDWRTMSQPGHLDLQRALVKDYGRYVARFEDIGRYLHEHQPPALMLWGRHDSYFDCAEILSWLQDLPRMEAHVLDGPHMLLETHAASCAELIVDFVHRGRRS
ncbi:pimeloyl-ACP methyl ester carboxylesterase [Variovorax paradoxus]|uniref:alpha/beta fold hydrolase n=1 Tax=Variovorax paradoxus TaxID=34073 RepID=UPI002792DDE0|nr:alpha/beta hydrolase [Variovorax paradoxus]MDQ0572334.1 pimeloyl-ACP methyl ester carboxylesterase [Variovorax paradoxus]